MNEINLVKNPLRYTCQDHQTRTALYKQWFLGYLQNSLPTLSLIAVEQLEDMLEGFLNSFKESGFLPKWLSPDERGLMPGTLIDAVIADACVKGIRPDLMPELLTAMKKAASIQSPNPNYGRQGTADYLKYGYVPSEYHESVNHTLDYCYSDFCIAQVASSLADPEASYYQQQAKTI